MKVDWDDKVDNGDNGYTMNETLTLINTCVNNSSNDNDNYNIDTKAIPVMIMT